MEEGLDNRRVLLLEFVGPFEARSTLLSIVLVGKAGMREIPNNFIVFETFRIKLFYNLLLVQFCRVNLKEQVHMIICQFFQIVVDKWLVHFS